MNHSFEDFLKEKHAKNYTGTDDDMPDAFDNWLGQLDGQEYMDFAQEWGDSIVSNYDQAIHEATSKLQ